MRKMVWLYSDCPEIGKAYKQESSHSRRLSQRSQTVKVDMFVNESVNGVQKCGLLASDTEMYCDCLQASSLVVLTS
jgi:hypothetical protein